MNVHRYSSSSALFVSHRVDNFLVLRRKLVYSFINRIENTTNNLVRAILDSEYFMFSKLRQEWDKILYLQGFCLCACPHLFLTLAVCKCFFSVYSVYLLCCILWICVYLIIKLINLILSFFLIVRHSLRRLEIP